MRILLKKGNTVKECNDWKKKLGKNYLKPSELKRKKKHESWKI